MIDISSELFELLKTKIEEKFKGKVKVSLETNGSPTQFPCVTIEEISNVPVHVDSSLFNRYARLSYRIQVFSNKENGKRNEARRIYSFIDTEMQKMRIRASTYSTRPNVYRSNIYQITATYEFVAREDGFIFTR